MQNRMMFQGKAFVDRYGAERAETAPPIRAMLMARAWPPTPPTAPTCSPNRALGPDGPRIIHVGGGASLLDDNGVRFFDGPRFPEEFKPYAIGQIQALDAYRALPEHSGVTWSYLSPSPVHFAPGERTGAYRTGLDHPVTGEDGQSRISYEDFAVVDEIDHPRHLNRRFTVGY